MVAIGQTNRVVIIAAQDLYLLPQIAIEFQT